MPDLPKLPKPDLSRIPEAFRQREAPKLPETPKLAAALPKPDTEWRPVAPPVDRFNDPFNPVEPPPPPPLDLGQEKPAKPESGLSSLDAAHAFGSVLFSGFGRAIFVVFCCMLPFGFSEAFYRISLLDDGWRANGLRGVWDQLIASPGAIFLAPGNWMAALGNSIFEPFGVPYMMLFLVGMILAVRSEIHLVKLATFYALLSALFAALHFKMTNPVSLLGWLAMLAGIVWLYRWYWRQQITLEEEPSRVDEEDNDR